MSYRRTAMAAPVALVRITHRVPTRVSLVGESGTITEVDTGVGWTQPWDAWAPAVREALGVLESAHELPARHVVLAAPFPVEDGHGAPEIVPRPQSPASAFAPARAGVLPNLPEWIARDPRPAVAKLLGRPVSMINDANLAALGEARRGAARGADTAIHLLVRHGIGAGIVIHGRPLTGARGMAGEIGHVQVVKDGPYCFCGNRGCLVTQSFDPFKIDALVSRYGHEPSFDDLEDLIENGDAVALRFFSDLGSLLAKTLASTIVLLDPDILVVDAELKHTATPLISGLRTELARRCTPRVVEELTIVRGRLPDAIAYGALEAANDAASTTAAVEPSALDPGR